MATKNYDANRSDYKTHVGMFGPILNLLGVQQFDIDVCCTEQNIPARTHFTKEINGLIQKWVGYCFMNPPFKTAISWVRKAVISVIENGCEVWAVLPTNRTEVGYYHDYIFNNTDCVFGFLRRKQGFIIPGEEHKDIVPSIAIMIVCFTKRAAEIEKIWNTVGLFETKAFRGGTEKEMDI